MVRARIVVTAAAVVMIGASMSGQVKKGEIAGVRNFSRVDATVGCAGATDPSAMTALKKEGFVSVINLRQESEQGADIPGSRAAAQAAGLKYIHLPFNAAAPDAKVVESFLAAVADTSNQPAFIHCGSANRVGAVWMIKRAVQDGWPIEKARAEAETIGLTSPQLVTFATNYITSRR
jgi:uncharacterized protein (TIGR01244 family)